MRILSVGIVRARDDSCNNAGDKGLVVCMGKDHKDAGWNRHAPNIVDAARSRSLDPERRYRSDPRRIRSRLNGPTG